MIKSIFSPHYTYPWNKGRHSEDEYARISLAFKSNWGNQWHLSNFSESLDFTLGFTLERHFFWLLTNLDLIELQFVTWEKQKQNHAFHFMFFYLSVLIFLWKKYRRNIIQILVVVVALKKKKQELHYSLAAGEVKINFCPT